MMPLRIEVLENKGSAFDVTILGVGEAGLNAVKAYPLPAYGGKHWAIETLNLCDDDAFQHRRTPGVTRISDDSPRYLSECRQKISEIVRNTELLFVLADVSKDPDYENAFRFAEQHREAWNDRKFSILIDCSGKNAFSDWALPTVFSTIISVRDTARMYRPAEMLLTDMYTQWISMEYADVYSILERAPSFKFTEERCSGTEEVPGLAARLKESIKAIKQGEDRITGIMSVSVPQTEGLEVVDEIVDVLIPEPANGGLLFQMGYNSATDDRAVSVSLLYGRERAE